MQSYFPLSWEKVKISPIPKSEDPTADSDFRPLSILLTLSKFSEKLVAGQMIGLCELGIISPGIHYLISHLHLEVLNCNSFKMFCVTRKHQYVWVGHCRAYIVFVKHKDHSLYDESSRNTSWRSVTLESDWNLIEITLEWLWNHIPVTLDSHWNHIWMCDWLQYQRFSTCLGEWLRSVYHDPVQDLCVLIAQRHWVD